MNCCQVQILITITDLDNLKVQILITQLEKYGVWKVAYIPSNEQMTNVLLLTSTSVPDFVEVGNNIIKTTDMKIFTIDQMMIAREIMACDNTT